MPNFLLIRFTRYMCIIRANVESMLRGFLKGVESMLRTS